jgi:hypothetical protein
MGTLVCSMMRLRRVSGIASNSTRSTGRDSRCSSAVTGKTSGRPANSRRNRAIFSAAVELAVISDSLGLPTFSCPRFASNRTNCSFSSLRSASSSARRAHIEATSRSLLIHVCRISP